MSTPYESAMLNLKLFEMRREPLLREARTWFVMEFTPESFAELAELAGGERNRDFRTVLSYWEMAASMVTSGAIDATAFLAAHNEVVAAFGKVYPFLAELRERFGEPEFCRNLESVVMGMPDAEATVKRRRDKIRAAADARKAAAGAGC
jgi:hypothetical protein